MNENKVYTKTGDDGFTSLISGKRVPKHDKRIKAYGAIDELIAWLGLVRDTTSFEDIKKTLTKIQKQLMVLAAELAIDKEKNFGMHTSSRNTEIIHAGIYYKPNTFKAKFCIKGKELLYDFCNQYNVNYKKCGKVFVGHNLNDLKNFDTIINILSQSFKLIYKSRPLSYLPKNSSFSNKIKIRIIILEKI